MVFSNHVYNGKFWKPDSRCFFQLILNCFGEGIALASRSKADFRGEDLEIEMEDTFVLLAVGGKERL